MNTKAIAYLEEAETVLATYLRDVTLSEDDEDDDAPSPNPMLIFVSISRLISRAVGLLEAESD